MSKKMKSYNTLEQALEGTRRDYDSLSDRAARLTARKLANDRDAEKFAELFQAFFDLGYERGAFEAAGRIIRGAAIKLGVNEEDLMSTMSDWKGVEFIDVG